MKRTLKCSLMVYAALALALISACSAAQPGLSPTAARPSATPAIQTAAPLPPTQAATALPPAAPLTAPGSDWLSFSAQGAQFAVPPTWKQQAPGQFVGADGFSRLETLPTDWAAPGAACIGIANGDQPAQFGQFPEIRDIYKDGQRTGCLILPSPDQPAELGGESLLLAWSPATRQPATRLALYADRIHIEAIAQSLRLPAEPSAAKGCDTTVQNQPARTITAGGLRITEFAVAADLADAICDPAAEPVAFNELASGGQAAARTAAILNGQFSSQRLARLNTRLAPFGINTRTSERRFAIDQNGDKLHSNLSWIGPMSVNASGSDFHLPVVDGYDGGTFVLSPTGLQRQEGWDILLYDRVFAVFVGDDLISLAYDYERYPRQVNNPALLNVARNGTVIDTWSVSGATPDGGPVRGLSAWDGHWLLELPGLLIEDGHSLNERLGYSEMFTWRRLNERPFYFYRQDGQVHISYNNQTLDLTYDQVIHEPLGGNAILLRLKAFETGMFFYARRGAVWHYVTIESSF